MDPFQEDEMMRVECLASCLAHKQQLEKALCQT